MTRAGSRFRHLAARLPTVAEVLVAWSWALAFLAGGMGAIADIAIALVAVNGQIAAVARLRSGTSGSRRMLSDVTRIGAAAAVLLVESQAGAWLLGWAAFIATAAALDYWPRTVRLAVWAALACAAVDIARRTTADRDPPYGFSMALGAMSVAASVLVLVTTVRQARAHRRAA